jgi:uncharacterized protein (DUF885 family)
MDKRPVITAIIALILISIISLSCSSLKDDKQLLNEVISNYESYESYDREKFPLGDFSEARYQRFYDFCVAQKSILEQIDQKNLARDDQRSFELLLFALEDHISFFQYKQHWNPLLSDSGMHNSLVYRVRPITNKEDALNYLKILKAIPLFVDQHLELLRKGLDAGISQPKVIFNGYASSYEDHITSDPTANFYFSPFKKLPLELDTASKDSIFKAGEQVVETMVVPSFQKIKTFFDTEYLPQTRTSIGASATPNGTAYYQNRIAHYTTLPLTAEEVHQIGLKEVAKIKAAMLEIIDEVGFKGSFSDFLYFLRTDARFYADTADQLLLEARGIAKRLDAQLPRFFKTLPRKPYGVAPVPDAIAPKYTGGRYIPSGENSKNPGYYWVNTYNLPSRPRYVLPALSAHEAVPGHHLQMALNSELPESIPQFRRNLYLSAYGEGWGLYTEKLAEEMGIYTTPYERFGQLTYSMWRACRLVVDTGMHALGWTREQAVAFMTENTALSHHEINTEIDRYISWPGQALSYKIGELKIMELRQRAKAALGAAFDIRDFHEVILQNGTLTLPMMEQDVQQYIRDNQ